MNTKMINGYAKDPLIPGRILFVVCVTEQDEQFKYKVIRNKGRKPVSLYLNKEIKFCSYTTIKTHTSVNGKRKNYHERIVINKIPNKNLITQFFKEKELIHPITNK